MREQILEEENGEGSIVSPNEILILLPFHEGGQLDHAGAWFKAYWAKLVIHTLMLVI